MSDPTLPALDQAFSRFREEGGGMAEDALSKAISAASDAADDSRQLELMKAVVMAQTIAQAIQPQQCRHQHEAPKQQFNTKKWLVIGGVACTCSLAFALASIAIAIGACCATACLLVLRSMWREFQRGK